MAANEVRAAVLDLPQTAPISPLVVLGFIWSAFMQMSGALNKIESFYCAGGSGELCPGVFPGQPSLEVCFPMLLCDQDQQGFSLATVAF